MPLLQSDLDEITFTIEEFEQAARVTDRLLGRKQISEGRYMSAIAEENLGAGEVVVVDSSARAKRWDGTGQPNGITVNPIPKGYLSWIQLK